MLPDAFCRLRLSEVVEVPLGEVGEMGAERARRDFNVSV